MREAMMGDSANRAVKELVFQDSCRMPPPVPSWAELSIWCCIAARPTTSPHTTLPFDRAHGCTLHVRLSATAFRLPTTSDQQKSAKPGSRHSCPLHYVVFILFRTAPVACTLHFWWPRQFPTERHSCRNTVLVKADRATWPLPSTCTETTSNLRRHSS